MKSKGFQEPEESPYYYARIEEIQKQQKTLLGIEINEKIRKINVPKKWISNTFIALFYKPAGDIVCPHFWELKPFKGCPFECSYCYLQGTFFGNKKPKKKDMSKLARVLDDFLKWADAKGLKLLLNAGETTDSLAIPSWAEDFINTVLPILERHKHHKILLLTKGGTQHIKPLLKIPEEKRKYFIASFSINPQIIAKKYELGTPPPEDRLKAAKKLQEEGYKVRIRIDPMMPIEGWRAYYSMLIEIMINKFDVNPEIATIGSLRGLRKTIKYAKDRSWTIFFRQGEWTNWGYKIRKDVRIDMYTIVIEKLKSLGYKGHIALCKETIDVWEKLYKENLLDHPGTYGIWENVKCNCKL